jgi:hypothetical protein
MLSRCSDIGKAVKHCTIGLICIVSSLTALHYSMLTGGTQLRGYQHFEATTIHSPFESVELVQSFAFMPSAVASVVNRLRLAPMDRMEKTRAAETFVKLFLHTRVLRL